MRKGEGIATSNEYKKAEKEMVELKNNNYDQLGPHLFSFFHIIYYV